MAHHLAADALIVYNIAFQNAVIKMLGSEEVLLTPTERIYIIMLKDATAQRSHKEHRQQLMKPGPF